MKEHTHPLLNHPIDVSREFSNLENTLFLPKQLLNFNLKTMMGQIDWNRYAYKIRTAFNQEGLSLVEQSSWEFPPIYDPYSELNSFKITFYGNRTVRIQLHGRSYPHASTSSLMLVNHLKPSPPWPVKHTKNRIIYQSSAGSLIIHQKPWRLEIRDASHQVLTQTINLEDHRSLRNTDPLPFCFIRPTPNYARKFAATFQLHNCEKIYGCGESFTRLDKRGQKLVLFTYDCHGVQHDGMYKPIPFFMSNRGYGMFLHTTSPSTFDFGYSYGEATTLFTEDEILDLFIFLGSPKEILSAYTHCTGRSPMPPF
jgi:alpha-D-xyloside xylohydrolase